MLAEKGPVRHIVCCRLRLSLMTLCRRLWGLELEDRWVWELDSSSPAKWSRHLVVACPHHAFPTNLAMGDFVRSLLTPEQVAFCGFKAEGHDDRSAIEARCMVCEGAARCASAVQRGEGLVSHSTSIGKSLSKQGR